MNKYLQIQMKLYQKDIFNYKSIYTSMDTGVYLQL